MTDPTEKSRKREALATAAAIVLLERRAKRGLVAAIATVAAVHHASTEHIESLVVAVGYAAIMRLREGARSASRVAWGKSTELTAETFSEPWLDAPRAQRSARSLATAWRQSVEEGLGRQEALEALQSHIERTASTEAVHAWAQEVSRQNERAASLGYVVTERYNALLDACDRCEEFDGTTATRPDTLTADPPLHPRCRCFVTTELEWPEALAS